MVVNDYIPNNREGKPRTNECHEEEEMNIAPLDVKHGVEEIRQEPPPPEINLYA